MASGFRSWVILLVLLGGYVGYLLLGAAVFSALEKPVEEKVLTELKLLKQELLGNMSCMNTSMLEQLINTFITANKYGISLLDNSTENSNWDLASSLFFSNALLTTIGYGNTAPLSNAGKAFSIVYAVIGVPFTMLVLMVCVQHLMVPFTLTPVAFWRRRYGLRHRNAASLHFILTTLLVIVLFFLLPAGVFSILEESWSFLEAFYFCFISLCTIGLGDFVPGEQPNQKLRPFYKISVMVYLFLGLLAMYLVLRSFHKMADVQGWTAYIQMPSCDDKDTEEEPAEQVSDTKPLDPSAHVSYNSFNK